SLCSAELRHRFRTQNVHVLRRFPAASLLTPAGAILALPPPSTSGLGHSPFKAVARVRIPSGAYGPVAQLVEQGTFNPKVAGSIPARPTRGSPRSGGFLVVRRGGESGGVAT